MIIMLPSLLLTLLFFGSNTMALSSIGILVNAVLPKGTVPSDSYNMGAWNGCQRAIAGYSSHRCVWLTASSTMDSVTRFTQLMEVDSSIVQVLVMDIQGLEYTRVLATRFPNVTFSLLKATVSPTDPPNMQGASFNYDQALFLAGVAAGALTKKNSIGVVSNMGFLNNFYDSYLRGALYVNPICQVEYRIAQDQTWSNKTWGNQLAKELLTEDVDVLWGAAGGLGSAAISYAASQKIWVIGVDTDESLTTFANKSNPNSNYIFGSAVTALDTACQIMVTERMAGHYFKGNKVFDISNGGVDFTACPSALACEAGNQTLTFIDQSSTPVQVMQVTVNELIQLVKTRMKVGALVLPSLAQGNVAPYLLNHGEWAPLVTFGKRPTPLYSHAMTFLGNNNILIFGGQTALGATSNQLFNLNFDVSDWQPVIPLSKVQPPGLTYHSAGFSNTTNELIVFGGVLSNNTVSKDLWVFSLTSKTWSLHQASGPGARTNQASAMIGDDLYVFGGQDASFTVHADLWKLNIPTRVWTQLASKERDGSTGPGPRINPAIVSANGTVLILYGGYDGTTELNELWQFSTATQAWTLLQPDTKEYTPNARSRLLALSLDPRRILFMGGVHQSQAQSESFIYNAALNKWQHDNSLDLPNPVQGLAGVAFSQAAYPKACQYGLAPICTPLNQTSIVVYGGSQPKVGVVGTLLISFPNPEIMPIPPNEMPFSVKATGTSVSGLGILTCLVLFVVVLVNREHPAFKSSSIMFQMYYLFGAAVALVGMVLYSLQFSHPTSCTASLFLFSTGTCILYSSIFSKNLRIAIVFKSKTRLHHTLTSNLTWAGIVWIPVVVNLALLIAFSKTSPYQILDYIADDGSTWPICQSSDINIWMWVLLTPNALCILGTVYVGFETRNVNSRYNEARLINSSAYVTALSLMILIGLGLSLKLPSTQVMMTSLICSLTIISVIGINFIPKVMELSSTNAVDTVVVGTGEGGTKDMAANKYYCRTCNQELKGGGVGKGKMTSTPVPHIKSSRSSTQPQQSNQTQSNRKSVNYNA